jgi:Tfp pilus assembly protein PilF
MKKNHNKIRELAGYLKKNPQDSFTKFALALELLKLDEVSKAQVLFESVLKQDPNYLGVYYHLGKLYERTGRPGDAKEMYIRGIRVAELQNHERTLAELKEALELLNTEMDYD